MAARPEPGCNRFRLRPEKYPVLPPHPLAAAAVQGAVNFKVFVTSKGNMALPDQGPDNPVFP